MTDLDCRLYKVWQKAVLDGKIVNQFEAALNDPLGRWHRGDQIIYGIRSNEGQLEYYAQNLSQSNDIQGTIKEKRVGELGYIYRLNNYRTLRPGGSGRPIGRQLDISPEPEHCRFYCQDRTQPLSLLNRDPLLQVKLCYFTWNAYYNAAPLDKEGHFLWVPTNLNAKTLSHMFQRLSPELLSDAIELFSQLDHTILFFNSLHAGASVNHIHFQAVCHQKNFPVEEISTVPYKGYDFLDKFPAQSLVFTPMMSINKIFDCIDRLQSDGIPFNLVMLGKRILLTIRDIEHEIVSEFPGDGFAALEMCGSINTVDAQAYDAAHIGMLETAYKKMVIPAKQIIDLWYTS